MDEKMVSLRINDIPVTVPEGSTVLEAARPAGFNIPSLCFLAWRSTPTRSGYANPASSPWS